MHSVWKNGWILLIAVLIPVILYGSYQLSTLSEDEENMNLIYQNQLDAILFSVNQSSDDIISGWVNTIERSLEPGTNSDSLLGIGLFQFQPSVYQIYIRENDKRILLNAPEADTVFSTDFLNSLLPGETDDKFEQLKQYALSGYRKIESKQFTAGDQDYLMLFFMLNNSSDESNGRLCSIVLDPEVFIRETLASRFQTIAQDRFIISAYQRGTDAPVYSTADSVLTESQAVTNDFWLLPDYYLSISESGTSVEEIIRRRTLTNLGLLLALILFIIIVAFLILRNVRREMDLAQKKADFVSNVSHELRTPLALISMFAETLEMDRVPGEEKKKEYYRIMQKESGRLTGIVNKILTFSRMESGRKVFARNELNLNEIVGEIVSNYEFHLESKGFTYQLELYHGRIPVIGDREGLEEVLINLLDNAIKYSKEEKHITIKTNRTADKGIFTVQDRGIGISKNDQEHVFDKFFRVSAGDLAQTSGTGLGLSLVKEIVDEHGGEVRLESEPGRGSIFMVILPLHKKPTDE